MAEQPDMQFFLRADALIHLANQQLQEAPREKVCASTMFAAARFNIWTHACYSEGAAHLASHRTEAIAYFAEQYRLMLEQHMDDYIQNFDTYYECHYIQSWRTP